MALTVTQSVGSGGTRSIQFSGAPAVGVNELLAAQGAGLSINVLAFSILSNGGDNAVYPATGSTGRMGTSGSATTINASGPAVGIVKNHCPGGWFEGDPNEALNIYASTTEKISGVFVVQVLNANNIPV